MRQLLLLVLPFLFLSLNANVLETILSTRKMRVCFWPEYYGITYINPQTQTLTGIDIDLAKELASDLGVEAAFVPSSFATLISDVQNKKCDIAMFAIGRTPQRLEQLTLTSPHLESDIYAITTKSNQRIQTWEDIDKTGNIVAVAKGTYHVGIMQERLKEAQLLIVDSMHAREKEVESGRADVFMTDFPFGVRMLEQRDWARLIRPQSTFHLTPYGWAMAKAEEPFLKRVETFISEIKKDGRLYKAALKHHLEPIVKTN